MGWLLGWLSWTNLGWVLVAGCLGWLAKWLIGEADTKGKAGPKAHGWADESANGHEDAGAEDEGSSSSFTGSVRLPKQKVEGATGEIARILSSSDHYAVLEVARDAPSLDIKKAYRLKQMATHPDKNQGVAGAKEASQRVNAAYDELNNEIKRKQYDVRLADEEEYGPRGTRMGGGMSAATMSELAKAFNAMVRETLGEAPPGAVYPSIDPSVYDCHSDAPDHSFHMSCACRFDHIASKVSGRSSWAARLCFCQHCGVMGCMLSARDGDIWFESSNRLLCSFAPERYIKAYRCVGSYVYDITDWAKCNNLLVDSIGQPAPTNVHYVPLRLVSSSASSNATGGWNRGADRRHKKQHQGHNTKTNAAHKNTNNKKKKRR